MTVTTISVPRSSQLNLPPLLLGFCMLMTGAAGLVNEYVLATTSSYILGNSIEQFSVTIGIMMFTMGLAGAVQRFVSDKFLFEKFVAVEVCMALLGGFAPLLLYSSFGNITNHFVLVQYVLVASVGFLIGFEIPIVMRLIDKLGTELKINLALVYGFDYVGAFCGALLWVYWLLPNHPLTEISFIVAGVNFIVAAGTVLFFSVSADSGFIQYRRVSTFAIVATLSALAIGYANNRSWSVQLQQKLYDDPIVSSTTTRYQHLVVTRDTVTNDYRLFINGHLQFSSLDEQIYHEQLVHPVMSLVPDHSHVLILGGGDGLALREVLKYKDVKSITLVDLDPEMIRFAKNDSTMAELNQNSFSDARVSLGDGAVSEEGGLHTVRMETGLLDKKTKRPAMETVASVKVMLIDADRFLTDVTTNYNVVIIDLPDPKSVELAKLYSVEFYRKLRKHLSKTGMLVVQSTSPYHAKETYLCIGRTLEAAGFSTLPYHDNVPSFGSWGWYLGWQSGEPVKSVQERSRRVKTYPVATRYLSPEMFVKSQVFGKGWLSTDVQTINTMMEPHLVRHYTAESWLVE